ncbi:uncharacterized protein IL334_002923 [Kwoniella shivajii]|uniref:WH1 domain-containing protein n=1 Tax=Kwoniella shivajii TaxID=564305 RepID=A0ABZ1CX92_9TREE|nr:hypothetical protein IL334_002923 [Kwoniella shivajii]
MVTEPRLLPVSQKAKPRWKALNGRLNTSVHCREGELEIHLLQDGKFIVKQLFTLLSALETQPLRKITTGPLALAFWYDSIQTPFISGMKMQERFQLVFTNPEDHISFLDMMKGYFKIVQTPNPPVIRTPVALPGYSQSQITIESRGKALKGATRSLTKTQNKSKIGESQSQLCSTTTRSPLKSTPQVHDDQNVGDIQPQNNQPTNGADRPSSSNFSPGQEVSPSLSPSEDDATERLKKALLGNFSCSPSQAQKDTTPPAQDLICNNTKRINSNLNRQGSHDIDSARPLSSYQQFPSASLDSSICPTVPPHPIYRQDLMDVTSVDTISQMQAGIHNSEHPPETQFNPTDESEPLIVFSPCLIALPSPITTSLSPILKDRPEVADLLSIDLDEKHQVLLTEQQKEEERLRKCKRKRAEMEDELEEESEDDEDDLAQASTGVSIETKPNLLGGIHSVNLPKLPYGRGVYDLSQEDLRKLVEEVLFEQGFNRLTERVHSIIDGRLAELHREQPFFHTIHRSSLNDWYTPHCHQSQRHIYYQDSYPPTDHYNPQAYTHPGYSTNSTHPAYHDHIPTHTAQQFHYHPSNRLQSISTHSDHHKNFLKATQEMLTYSQQSYHTDHSQLDHKQRATLNEIQYHQSPNSPKKESDNWNEVLDVDFRHHTNHWPEQRESLTILSKSQSQGRYAASGYENGDCRSRRPAIDSYCGSDEMVTTEAESQVYSQFTFGGYQPPVQEPIKVQEEEHDIGDVSAELDEVEVEEEFDYDHEVAEEDRQLEDEVDG